MVWGPGWEVSVATVQVRACRAGQLAQVLEAATHHPPQANVLRAFPIGHMLLLRRVITGPKAPSKPKMRIAGAKVPKGLVATKGLGCRLGQSEMYRSGSGSALQLCVPS